MGENQAIHARLGKNCKIGEYVIIGEKGREDETVIGDNANIRSHTVIYPGVRIGNDFQTGHGAMIREGT
jgi:UDP-3-O-[3-hydroxymyristoyl] glucosamine N-acyltransferase